MKGDVPHKYRSYTDIMGMEIESTPIPSPRRWQYNARGRSQARHRVPQVRATKHIRASNSHLILQLVRIYLDSNNVCSSDISNFIDVTDILYT